MPKRQTKEEFIEKSINKFGNIFNFSKTEYVDSRTEIIVTCPIHGDFRAIPKEFLRTKYGCPKCGHDQSNLTRRILPEEFMTKLKNKFGNKYDYSKVDYQGQKKYITLICPEHGEFTIRADNLQECQKCINHYRYTIQDVQNIANKHNITILEYINSKSSIKCKCNKCNTEFTTYFASLNNNLICPECTRQLKHKKFIDKLYEINPDIIILTEYQKTEENVLCKCKICNYEWCATPHNLLHGTGCPSCLSSKGERLVKSFLEHNKIKFIQQYKIVGDFNSRSKMFIDFYLPDYNTFIEYNGIQHYIPIKHFGGELQLQKQIIRDSDLRNYCEENNIKLIEIKYTENVFEILKNKLSEFLK